MATPGKAKKTPPSSQHVQWALPFVTCPAPPAETDGGSIPLEVSSDTKVEAPAPARDAPRLPDPALADDSLFSSESRNLTPSGWQDGPIDTSQPSSPGANPPAPPPDPEFPAGILHPPLQDTPQYADAHRSRRFTPGRLYQLLEWLRDHDEGPRPATPGSTSGPWQLGSGQAPTPDPRSGAPGASIPGTLGGPGISGNASPDNIGSHPYERGGPK